MLCANVEGKFVLALEQHVALGTDVCAVDEVNPVCSQPGIMMMTYGNPHENWEPVKKKCSCML